jgi:CheY-like chemotaxis protein
VRKVIRRHLQELSDVRLEEADSGLAEIERLGLGPVDLMTLDLQMPDMDGAAVLQFVRSYDSFNRLPIVMITTGADSTLGSPLMDQGLLHYLAKPFRHDEIVGLVRQMLESTPDPC